MLKKNAPEWLIRLLALRAGYYGRTFPNVVKDGLVPIPKKYSDKTANALTRSIKDWINFSGGDAARLNNVGIMRKVNGTMKYTKAGGRRGSGDLRIVLPETGRAASIEVKSGKDRMSPDQQKERQRIEQAGGLYFIASDMAGFVAWWDSVTSKTSTNA